jgi:hypothetical protein
LPDKYVDFGFKVRLADFEESKRYGKMGPAKLSVSIQTRPTFFLFQLGLIDHLIGHTMNTCRGASTTQMTRVGSRPNVGTFFYAAY